MNKKMLSYLTAGLLVLGSCAGLGTWGSKSARAAVEQPAGVTQEVNQQEVQKPAYTASIKVANQQNETNAKESEIQESAGLKALAKITPEQARTQATKAVPGEVRKVSLDNENGNLVYSVEVQTAGGVVDVKIDAGNGRVLAQDSGQGKEGGGYENGREEGTPGPDNDNVQLEQ